MDSAPSRPTAARPLAPEVLVAGHVSLDLAPSLSGPLTLAPGHLVLVGPPVVSTGGAVANVGLALHRLGVRVALSARVGPDLFGTAVLEALAAHERRLAEGITVAPGEVTSYTIVINPPGIDRSFMHCPGANQTFCADEVPYAELAGVRIFHFGYPPLMPRMYADAGAQLRSMFERVQDAGVTTSLDLCDPDPDSEAGRTDWQEVLAHTLPFVDVFAPSIEELLFMFDRSAHERLRADGELRGVLDHARLARLGGQLTRLGAAVVAIKLGDQGLYLRTSRDRARIARFSRRIGLDPHAWHDRELLSPCFAPRVINGTTGSGDATVAGLLATLLRGADPLTAATGATAVGACSVEGADPTCAIPAWAEVSRRLERGWSRSPVELELPSGLICA